MAAVVAVILAGVSIPLLVPRYQTYQMRAAAWRIAGDLRLARQRAVTTRVCYRFAFADSAAGADANSYVLQYAGQQPCQQPWVQEVPAAPGARQRLSGAVQISPGSTPSGRAITFNPNGSAVPSGTVQLTGPGGVALSVTVDQAGRVQVN